MLCVTAKLDARLPIWVIRNRALRLQRILVSAMPPVTTKELQRCHRSRWAKLETSCRVPGHGLSRPQMHRCRSGQRRQNKEH